MYSTHATAILSAHSTICCPRVLHILIVQYLLFYMYTAKHYKFTTFVYYASSAGSSKNSHPIWTSEGGRHNCVELIRTI